MPLYSENDENSLELTLSHVSFAINPSGKEPSQHAPSNCRAFGKPTLREPAQHPNIPSQSRTLSSWLQPNDSSDSLRSLSALAYLSLWRLHAFPVAGQALPVCCSKSLSCSSETSHSCQIRAWACCFAFLKAQKAGQVQKFSDFLLFIEVFKTRKKTCNPCPPHHLQPLEGSQ